MTLLQRRAFLRSFAAAGLGGFFYTQKGAFAQALVETPAMTIGPYYPDRMPLDLDNDLLIINDNITPGVGTILWLSGRILSRTGAPVRNALVEIWQADNNGSYIHSQGGTNKDVNFQGYGKFLTGSNGEYLFRTISPAIYPGRTRHIHLAVTAPGQSRFVTQVFRTGESLNATDGVLSGVTNAAQRASVIVDWNPLASSAIGELAARFDVVLGFTPTETPAPARPTMVASGPISDAANLQPVIAPGSWVTITGNGLSSTTRVWTAADIVGNKLPESLDRVSVRIDNQPASVYYVSPTQLNVLAPNTLSSGSVNVTVTNANGTSDLSTVTAQSTAPAFFLFPQDYVAALRSDGAYLGPADLIAGATTVPAKPGDTIVLYGTGFGATNPAVASGETFSGTPALANPLKLRMDNKDATVTFAGLISPGLYQINVVVPDLADGDHTIRAELAGNRNQRLARLRVSRSASAALTLPGSDRAVAPYFQHHPVRRWLQDKSA